MHSKAYIAGFVCGLLVVAAICVLIALIQKKKNGGKKAEYDERQMAIRGRGFQIAYFTALFVLIIGGMAEMAFDYTWCDLFTFAMIALWLSLCVFVTYCVVKDAYFALRSRRKSLVVIMLAAGAINLLIGLGNGFAGNGFLTNGKIGLSCVNLLTGCGCLYMGIMMLAWTIHERRQETEE